MAVTQQRTGVGNAAYPFYLADYALDVANGLLPTPRDSDATAFVLETKQTFIWRNGGWVLFQDSTIAQEALTSSVQARTAQLLTWAVRELREIRRLLIAQQGGIPILDPLPDIDT